MPSLRLALPDPAYPSALAALVGEREGAEPPPIYVRGTLPLAPGVAVVGTRAPSAEACEFTRALVHDLAAQGFSIWSGGALGIDAAAHEAALAAGAATVVVAGGGLDRPYPKEHIGLFDRVLAAGGALVSRVADDVPPSPPRFLQRNAVLAAATVVTVVIEAGFSSGARSTAAAARRMGRPLCVVPHAPWDPRGAGCALELARGARATISAEDVIAAVGVPVAKSLVRRRAASRASCAAAPPDSGAMARAVREQTSLLMESGIDEPALAVLVALGASPLHVDEICDRARLALPAVVSALLTLTLQAIVVEGPAGSFRRTHRPPNGLPG